MSGFHGFSPRSGDLQPLSQYVPSGKYGRMFPKLPPLFQPGNLKETEKILEALTKLGNTMVDQTGEASEGDNNDVPAGYTYLGQFIDHDITFDSTGIQETIVDPLAIINFRTPRFDLDSLYGSGPKVQPYLYKREDPFNKKQFVIGKTIDPGKDSLENDLPRFQDGGLALIADPRNDENLIVAQLHLAFLKFHNQVLKSLESPSDEIIAIYGNPSNHEFEIARKIVIWHYQWIIIHDFLNKILDPEVLKDVLCKGRRFYQYTGEPFIPVEFSVAAFRLGHSMLRFSYDYNCEFETRNLRVLLKQLFEFTGVGGGVPIPRIWVIDWQRFFRFHSAQDISFNPICKIPNSSRKIDPYLSSFLRNLPIPELQKSLAIKNLIRGFQVGLPSGQSVARFMRLEPLSAKDIITDPKTGKITPDGEVLKNSEFNLHLETPLWYYILKEAEVQAEGKYLGQVGSRILAEVFVGLLQGDNSSFMIQYPDWKPTLEPLDTRTPGDFKMSDLLKFAGDINPLKSDCSITANGRL